MILRVIAVVLALEVTMLQPSKAQDLPKGYAERVIRNEVDEPLKDFERRFPPGFGATHEESRQRALNIWAVNTQLSSSESKKSGCSREITDAWNVGRKGLKPHHDKLDRFRFAAALCGDLSRLGEPLSFLNCSAPFRRLCR